jgi:hypothetical protein
MEAITRIVADSLARHGLDRPVDPRRLQWSRWFRCDSPHSLLVVPSKPGIFAIAEEVMDLGTGKVHVGTAVLGCPAGQSSAAASSVPTAEGILGGVARQRCDSQPRMNAASAAELPQRRMLAVLQFSEDDDMAFTLDRMFTCANPMRARLASGSCFLRFVVIEDANQRRTICAALNQWMQSSAEKASGLPADFQSSLELTDCARRVDTVRVGRTLLSDYADATSNSAQAPRPEVTNAAPYLDSGANKNLHCPHPLPSGF